MDDETRLALQQLAGDDIGIPASLHGRLRGDSLGELKADARRLADELGIGQPDRDEHGRFVGDMNARIRRAAGRAA
jgi:hypothetical protein